MQLPNFLQKKLKNLAIALDKIKRIYYNNNEIKKER